MAKVLNFNVAALALLGANVQVRIRVKDDALQVRPSARVLASNLPEGEVMRNVSFKREGDKVRGAVVNLKDFGGEAGQAYELSKGKYGWLNLTPVAEVAKGAAYGRVAVK